MNRKIILLIILGLLTSCECWVFVKAKIVDKDTGRPINNATVEMTNFSAYPQTTDSTGNFEIRSGSYLTCPQENPILKFQAVGYKTIEIEINNEYRQQNKENDTLFIQLSKVIEK